MTKIIFGTSKLTTRDSDILRIIRNGERPLCVTGDNPNTFRSSQVVDSIMHYYTNKSNTCNKEVGISEINESFDDNYIISTCVAYHPHDWTDYSSSTSKSLFEYLSDRYLNDLRNRKAMLLIDQSVEGYGTSWLWDWFHKKCQQYEIDPSAIMYFTGDQSCSDSYDFWCRRNNVTGNKLNVFPSASLGMYVRLHYERNKLDIRFDELLEYKTLNKDSLFLFDNTNMRPRKQRMLNFLTLFDEGLLEYGNISMPKKSDWGTMGVLHRDLLQRYKLPADVIERLEDKQYFAKHSHSNEVDHYWIFVERILHDMYKNSWVSLITESSYFKDETTVFISEKTFKPLACCQPFVILGSRHSLKYLKKMGFKTFHPYIDESYDELNDEDRFRAVAKAIKKIQLIEDKVSWYESMRDILEHNQKLFLDIIKTEPAEWAAIKTCYSNYFNKDV